MSRTLFVSAITLSFLTACECKEGEQVLDFETGQSADEVDDFLQRNGFSSTNDVSCEDLCLDMYPDMTVDSCELIWDEDYLNGGDSTQDTAEDSYEAVNSISCTGTRYETCL